MSHYYKLKGARWLRLYTAAANTPVYAAQSDAQTIADTLCDVPWTRAGSDGPAMFTVHEAKALDQNVDNRDRFDAAEFCAGHADGQHRVYANAAFYVCALPQAAQGATLESVKVHVHSDPYNELGVRIAVHLLDTDALPTDCATVRSGAAHADGQVPRETRTVNKTNYWYAADGDVTITLPAGTATKAYLAVFVGLENYARSRSEWIEGSAYISNSITIATTEEISGWTENTPQPIDSIPNYGGEFAVVRGGVAPIFPEGSAGGARVIQLQLNGDPLVPIESVDTGDPSRTQVYAGGSLVYEISGTVSDVSYSRPVTIGNAVTRFVAICGVFGESSYGIEGLLIFNAATGGRLDGSAVTLGSGVSALLGKTTTKIGASVILDNTTPYLCLYAADFTPQTSLSVTTYPFLKIDLSTGTASTNSRVSITTDVAPAYSVDKLLQVEFYDIGHELSHNSVDFPPLACAYSGVFDDSPSMTWCDGYVLSSDEHDWVSANGINLEAAFWLAYKGTLSGVSIAHALDDADNADIIFSGDFSAYALGAYGNAAIVPDAIPVSKKSIVYPAAALYSTDPLTRVGPARFVDVSALSSLAGLKVGETAKDSGVYVVTGAFRAVGGDMSLGTGFVYDEATNTRTALGYGTPPYAAATGSAVVPAPSGDLTPCYWHGDIRTAPSAADSAAGLRTLQAHFYLGRAESVARATRERMGAAYSVRATTASLKVVGDGGVSVQSVPVWRMFASALVVPFALPTAWTARKLRLDWTDWTGTATAGARFNVWLKAGDYIESCPDILASDIPYDALEAETAGWTLVGTVDAAGAATEATFELPEIAGKKTATLMLTAFASADRINPDANSVWPVGAAKEVDATGGEVVNADKAWLPDVTLEG